MAQRLSLFFGAVEGGGVSRVANVDEIVEFKHTVRAIVKNHGELDVTLRFQGSADNSSFSNETMQPGNTSYVTVDAKAERAIESYLTAGRKYFRFSGAVTPATVNGVVEKSSEVEVEIREIVPTTGLTIR